LGIRLHKEPKLEKPDIVASWPGIGNIGIIAVDTLRGQIRAEELGEIEPWDFFYPRKVIIKAGVLEDLDFPRSKFYYKKLAQKDLIFSSEKNSQLTEEGCMPKGGRRIRWLI